MTTEEGKLWSFLALDKNYECGNARKSAGTYCRHADGADASIHLMSNEVVSTYEADGLYDGRGLCEAFNASVPKTLLSILCEDLQRDTMIDKCLKTHVKLSKFPTRHH